MVLLLMLEGLIGIRTDGRPGAILGLHVEVLLAGLLAAEMIIPWSCDRGTGCPVVKQLVGGVAEAQSGEVSALRRRTAGQEVHLPVAGSTHTRIHGVLPQTRFAQYIVFAFVKRLRLTLAPQGARSTSTGHLSRQGGVGIGAQSLLQGVAGQEELLLLVERVRPLRLALQLIHFVLGYVDLLHLGRRVRQDGRAGRGGGHQIGLLLLLLLLWLQASVVGARWSGVHPGRLVVIALVIVVIAAAALARLCRIAVLVELYIGHHIGGSVGPTAVVQGGRLATTTTTHRRCSVCGAFECRAGDFRVIGHIQR